MIAKNLAYTIFSFGFFGIFTDLQNGIFSTLPGPLFEMYNKTAILHYGLHFEKPGLSFISSLMSVGLGIGSFSSAIFLMPLMDKKGRIFVAVILRCLCGFTTSLLQLLAGIFGSAELFFFGQIFLGVTLPIKLIVTLLFVSECAPDKNRGFASAALLVGDVLASLLIYFLSLPRIFGASERWPIIPFISLILSAIMFVSTSFLPESPKWLISKARKQEAAEAIKFYHGDYVDVDKVITSLLLEKSLVSEEKLSFQQAWKNETMREAIKIIIAMQLFLFTSPLPIERMYTVTLHTTLGLNVDQSMILSWLTVLLFAPFRFLGTFAIDKFGRRPVVFIAAGIMFSKLIFMFTAQLLVFVGSATSVTLYMAVANEIMSELFSSTGVGAVGTLLIAELIPPTARVSIAQITLFLPMASILPMIILYPVVNSIFGPAFYVPMIIVQPILVGYLYRYLPETKARSVYEIVQNFDENVRSRANTCRSLPSERTPLVGRSRRNSYLTVLPKIYNNTDLVSS